MALFLQVAAVSLGALLAWALARAAAFFIAFHRLEWAIPGPPGMTSLPVLGHTLYTVGVAAEDLMSVLMGYWNQTYKLVHFSGPGVMCLFLSEPDDIEEMMKKREAQDKSHLFYDFLHLFTRRGLILLNGGVWRAHRKALQPAFHREVLERSVSVVAEECEGFCLRAQPGLEQDVTPDLTRMLVAAFMRTALEPERSPEQEQAIADLTRLMEVFFPTVMKRTFSPWLWPDWAYGLTRAARESRRLKADVDRFCRRVIDRRRAALRERQKAAVGEEAVAVERPTLLDIMVGSGEAFSDNDIVDQINMFAMAAVETTTASLGWTLKALSVLPDVQERVAREVADVLGDAKVVDLHQLDRLEYTERVIKESMRLHPPVSFVGRETAVETKFLGYRVPRGTVFVPNIRGVHRHPTHWPDPMRFDPDRFLPERSEGRHPCAYIPFSTGPRNCIGLRQAMITMKTFVATVVRRFRVEPADDGHRDIASFPEKLILATYMQGGFRVALAPRHR